MKNNLFIIFTFVAAAFLLSCTMSSSGSSGDSGSSNSTGGGSSESGGSGSGSGGTTINYYFNYATLPPAEISASLPETERTEYLRSLFRGLSRDSTVTLTGNLSEDDLSTIAECIIDSENKINLDLSGASNLPEIPPFVFLECEKLTGITLPDSVTTIEDGAFECCGLEHISIPDTVTDILPNAFNDCENLISIDVSDSHPNYSSDEEGVLYDKNKTTLICVPGGKSGSYTIPGSVETICNEALFYCVNLTDINVSQSNSYFSASQNGSLLTKDGKTLIRCPAGKTGEFTIPDSVETIEHNAFYMCQNLTDIIIPNSVTTIEIHAFQSCTGLQSIEIPDSVETIGYGAFEDCSNLTSITIPASVNRIGFHVFQGCRNLNSVTFDDTTDTWKRVNTQDAWELRNSSNPTTYNLNNVSLSDLNDWYWYR